MPVTVALYEDLPEFIAHVRPVLRREEARNNLPLGILWQLENRDVYDSPELAVVRRNGEIIGVLLRTPPWPWCVTTTSDDETDEVAAAVVEHLVMTGAEPAPINARAPLAQRVAEQWAETLHGTAEVDMAMRVMACTEVDLPAAPSGSRRRAHPDDVPLIAPWFEDFQQEVFHRPVDDPDGMLQRLREAVADPDSGLWLWDDDGPVSLANIGRPTGTGERVGPVYTPPEFRGRGYAGRLVAEVTADAFERGLSHVFLFTDASNPTSNALYERVGYAEVGRAAVWNVRGPASA